MKYDLCREFAVALTGDDCAGAAAWLQQALLDTVGEPALRAMLHWEAADEKVRQAIYSWLGYADGDLPFRERAPIHPAIAKDYKAVEAQMGVYFEMD